MHKCQLGWHWDNTIKTVGSLGFSVTVPNQLMLQCSVLLRMLNSTLPWMCAPYFFCVKTPVCECANSSPICSHSGQSTHGSGAFPHRSCSSPTPAGKFLWRSSPPRVLLPKGCKCKNLNDFLCAGTCAALLSKQQLLLKSISRWNTNLLTLRYESHEKRVLAFTRTHLTLLSFTFLLVPQIKYPHVSRRCIKFLLFAVRGRSNILVVGVKPGYPSVPPAASMNTLSLLSSKGTCNPA